MRRTLGLLTFFLPFSLVAAPITLVDKGEAKCQIFLAPGATPVEQYAAKELQQALAKATGTEASIIEGKAAQGPAIVLATPDQFPELAEKFTEAGGKDAIAVFTKGDTLYLVGKNPRSVLYATYRFLEESLGFRWLWPGKDGEFFRKTDRLEVDDPKIHETAGMPKRALSINSPHYDLETLVWMARNRFNIHHSTPTFKSHQHEALKERGFTNVFGGHSLILPRPLLEANPDFVAQYGGVRKLTAHSPHLCWSNEGVQQALINLAVTWSKTRPMVDIWTLLPTDHGRFCQCEACIEMAPDVSTRFQKLAKIVIDGVRKVNPDARFNALAYQGYRDVPSEVAPFETVAYTAYNVSYRHSLKSGSPSNKAALSEMKAWKEAGAPIGFRGYDMIPFKDRLFTPLVSYEVEQIDALREAGVESFSTEVTPFNHPKDTPPEERNWDSNRMNLYAIGRALWNPAVTPEEVVEDWTTTVYGKDAGAVMARYYFEIEKAWKQTPGDISYFLHPGALYVRGFFSPELIKQAETAFSEARQILKQQDSEASARGLPQVAFEEKLFGRWKALYQALEANSGQYTTVALESDAAEDELMNPESDAWKKAPTLPPFRTAVDTAKDATEVAMLWKGDTLYLRILCQEQPGAERTARFSNHDEDIWADDSIEIFLNQPNGSGYHHLAVNSLGARYDAKSEGGMNLDKTANPNWAASAKAGASGWMTTIALPLAEFGYSGKDEVNLSLARTRVGGKEKSGWPSNAYHSPASHGTIRLLKQMPGHVILYRNGERSSDALEAGFRRKGWKVDVSSTEVDLPEGALFFVRYGSGKSFELSDEYMEKSVLPWLEKGGTMIVTGIGAIPFEKWFMRDDLKVKWSGWGVSPFRTTASLVEGKWSHTPNDLSRTLNKGLAPSSAFIPSTDQWEPLAWLTMKDDTTAPYLLRAKVGEGTIYLTTSSMGYGGGSEMFGQLRPDNVVKLIENLSSL